MSPKSSHPIWKRALVWLYRTLRTLLYLTVGLYCFGVVYFDGPLGQASTGNLILAIAWACVTICALAFSPGVLKRLARFAVAAAIVLIPWSFKRPSNERDWRPEFRMTGHNEIDGDTLTFHNLRNFDYTADGQQIERWETRSVKLSNLRGLDYFQNTFGGKLLAHPVLSFDFGPDGHVCLTIEARREKGESYTAIGGLFKIFDLQYMFGSEEDLIRLRASVRDSPSYLYATSYSAEDARELLFNSVKAQNKLFEKPRFYNVLSHNCSTSLRVQTPAEEREAFDFRMLANGMLDEYLYEKGAFAAGDLPFDELQKKSLINEAAKAAHADPEFSKRIRQGRPGF